MLLGPCVRDTQAAVCATFAGGGCPLGPGDPALKGALLTDKTFTLGGLPGHSYSIKLHIQGEVESKRYTNSVDQSSAGMSPMLDGFATAGVGGVPTSADAYNVYMIRVTNPGSTTSTDYFLNSLQLPGVSNHTTYGVDYTATIQAKGGATVRLVASDPNCSQIKNCGPIANDGNVCAMPLVIADVEPAAKAANPNFNFTVPYNGQWLSIAVKSVASP